VAASGPEVPATAADEVGALFFGTRPV